MGFLAFRVFVGFSDFGGSGFDWFGCCFASLFKLLTWILVWFLYILFVLWLGLVTPVGLNHFRDAGVLSCSGPDFWVSVSIGGFRICL